MEYRFILELLCVQFPDKPFSAKSLSNYLPKVLYQTPGFRDPLSYSVKLSTKRISDDLDRLYRMKFLKRKRKKRRVTTKNGNICNRGYYYQYRVSKQGWQYVQYLDNPAKAITSNESKIRFEDLVAIMALQKRLPGQYKPNAYDLYFNSFGGNGDAGRYKRFPKREPKNLLLLFKRMVQELGRKDKEIEELRSRLQTR